MGISKNVPFKVSTRQNVLPETVQARIDRTKSPGRRIAFTEKMKINIVVKPQDPQNSRKLNVFVGVYVTPCMRVHFEPEAASWLGSWIIFYFFLLPFLFFFYIYKTAFVSL